MPFSVNPTPGTRFPNFGDEELPFEPSGALRQRVTWAEILGYHSPSERKFTLLASHETWISAASCVAARTDDLLIEFLTRNVLFQPEVRVAGASVLVGALENIADQLTTPTLRLESVEDKRTLEWYAKLGFQMEGEPHWDEEWGILYPMVKRVAPFGHP